MKRLVRPAPIGGSALVRDYLQGNPAALRFFTAGSPYDLASFRRKLLDVSARFQRPEREAAANALKPTSENARLRLERFVEEGGAMVTTGQQAGLLTGPLYTVYKALSAVALAQHLEESLGTLVIPVFWVASDDHDWAEVNHADLLDSKNRVRRVALESGDQRALPMSQRVLEGDLDELCDQIIEVVAPSGHTEAITRSLVAPYRVPGMPVAAAFAESIRELLSPFDVCITDSADPSLKRTAAPLIRRSLEESGAQEAALAERTRALEDAGYRGQVAVLPGGANIFRQSEAGRERLYRRGEEFLVRERKGRFPVEELLAEVDGNPEAFSPNVFLRPVVESFVFPTVAYVGGPGEVAYFAQANALFELNEIAPPVIVPRYAGLVVEPKVEKLLDSLGLQVSDTTEPREALVERLARRGVPTAVTESLDQLREDLVRDFDQLVAGAEAMDPALAREMGSIRNRSLLLAEKAERKVLRAIKRGDSLALEKLDRVLDTLRPHGEPQDRVLNVLPFLARFGAHFLREVERSIAEEWRLPGLD